MTDYRLPKNNLVLIPIYNEAKYVIGVIEEVKKYVCESSVILAIDDGSTDDTPKLLKEIENIEIMTHDRNMGYGQTLIDGFNYAIEKGYENVITIDCDWQHEPAHIMEFCDQLDDYDIISCSRYLRLSHEDPPPDRMAVNQKITRRINEITGFDITDSFCGFKAYSVDSLKKLKLTEINYGMPLQLWIQAWKHGLKIKEFPIGLIYFDRTRQFPGDLKNSEKRLKYYNDIIDRELANG